MTNLYSYPWASALSFVDKIQNTKLLSYQVLILKRSIYNKTFGTSQFQLSALSIDSGQICAAIKRDSLSM
jgi:hypothetical protein